MNSQRFSRRKLLAGLGASAALLPLLHAERTSAGPGSGFPKRLVTVTWGDGIVPPTFYPSGNDLTIGDTLRPLEAWKDKMIVIKGLDLTVMLDVGGREYDGHFSYPTLLTGTADEGFESRIAHGPSIDQFITNDLIQKGVNLTAPLINIGVKSNGDGNPTSWRAAGQYNEPETDPKRLFDRLFAGRSLPAPQIDALRNRRKSILDVVGKDLTAFGKRLGTEDRTKIDAHLESIRELERQLGTGAGTGAACTNPESPTGDDRDIEVLMKVMFGLAAAAIRCDVSRVVNIDLYDDGGGDGNSFPFLDINRDYHAVAHDGPSAYDEKTKIDAWNFEQVARMVKSLDETPEGTGTALDHTVILTANDMNEGASHYVGEIPFVLIGSCDGYFKTGQYVKYDKKPHNRLLTTLCNAMDIPVTSYGAPGYEGNLPELVA